MVNTGVRWWRRLALLGGLGWLLMGTHLAAQEVSDAAVAERIGELVTRLKAQQRGDGSWALGEYSGGLTALVVLALRQAGVPPEDRALQLALAYLLQHTDEKTYSEGLVPCALEAMGPGKYLERHRQAVAFLEQAQREIGVWSYTKRAGGGDNSNAQFAALGLAAAERCGVPIPPRIRERALRYWSGTQQGDGGWGYTGASESSLAMTCAGIASLHLLGVDYSSKTQCCGETLYDTRMARGLQWLSGQLQRAGGHANIQNHPNYALYALERVGMLLDTQEIGGVPWYRWGAATMLRQGLPRDQSEQAFSLLFLAKGDAPIGIAKWPWAGDWNRQPRDVRRWVEWAGGELGQRLDWTAAPLDRLDSPAAKASLIYLNGRGEFRLTEPELKFLRAFLDEGGSLVAEAGCDSRLFVESFKRQLLTRLYPELSPRWQAITRQHPALWSKHELVPDDLRAEELKCECRELRILLIHRGISCALNGDADARADLPRTRRVATNLLAWARQSRAPDKKLDNVELTPSPVVESLTPDQLQRTASQQARQFLQPLGRVKHRGDWLVAPGFFAQVQELLRAAPKLPDLDGEIYAAPTSEDLHQAAVLFMAGQRAPLLREEEWLNLRLYLQNGGFLLATAACSSRDFDTGFRQLLKQMLPNDQLEPIPADDPLRRGPLAANGLPVPATRAYADRFGADWGPLLGVRRAGRWIVVYSPVDLCSDLGGTLQEAVPAYRREAAWPLIANALHYAFSP